MARRKVSPEAQIIALFTGLSDESKRMVMFGLNAITSVEIPKPPIERCYSCGWARASINHNPTHEGFHPFESDPSRAAKKSSRKNVAENSTANTEVETANVSSVGASGD